MEGLYSKLPVNDFKWIENTSQFSKYFLGNYYEVGDNGYFLEVDVQYPQNLHSFTMIYSFYLKEWKLKKSKNL